jgi:hypothetical protein
MTIGIAELMGAKDAMAKRSLQGAEYQNKRDHL